MEKTTILFIEDEQNLLNSLAFILENNGFTVMRADNGEEGLRLAAKTCPDLVILDISLPGISGFGVARKLRLDRTTRHTPILMLTGHTVEEEIAAALETVADDYMAKPVKPRLLIARIHALLRRNAVPADPAGSGILCSGNIMIDTAARTVTLDGTPVQLTRSEFEILSLIAASPGKVFSRSRIITAIRGDDFYITERSVDFLVSGLRHKLGNCGRMIQTVRGIGFKFMDETADAP